ncbi:hypothetical protein JSO59_001220 [Riemerella anatipestifer]|uniref:hypothetical protein n=1 Tax=Riemerella anatipestifer TaxID=34085 RepID=UPI0030C50632
MKKIEKIVDSCNDCRFAKEFESINCNTDFVLICTRFDEIEEDLQVSHQKSFMLARASRKIKGYIGVDIPDNCPLEDYGKSREL